MNSDGWLELLLYTEMTPVLLSAQTYQYRSMLSTSASQRYRCSTSCQDVLVRRRPCQSIDILSKTFLLVLTVYSFSATYSCHCLPRIYSVDLCFSTFSWNLRTDIPGLKERHGSGNKGCFESSQNKSKVCLLTDRECIPLFVVMDTSCKLYFKSDNILLLRTNNSLVDYQLLCPPLRMGKTEEDHSWIMLSTQT